MIRAFRIVKTARAGSAFDGEGARLYGGRWNSAGVAVVYVASSLSLATLEVMVHLEELAVLTRLYSFIMVEFSTRFLESAQPMELARGWNEPAPQPASMRVGDEWVRARRSAVLAVPSVVTPGEWNYLLNPRHPDFSQIRIHPPQPFRIDPRLE